MSTLEVLLARLEAEESLRGRGFEQLVKWVLENAPEYAARLGRVWLWADWPGNGGRIDAGIDLVAEDRYGGLWAVQSKHYDPGYAIKKADLDSFLSESSRREFSYRLLIATTDRIGPTARRTLEGQEKPVGMLLRSDLATLGLRWPRSLTQLRGVKAKPKRARPHQRRAVSEIMAGLEARDRGQVVMACGTGKTLVARFLHDEMSSKRTLVLVPSLSLLKQSLREWLSVGEFAYLAVCSDETVTPDDADAVVSSTTELGVPVTTDAAEIATFLRRRGGGVVFATYQSSPRIAAAQGDRVPRFDLVVADEAHRCAGPEAGVFATVLDPTKIKASKRVFMTATPRYFTGRVKKAAQDADWEVASMDDEARFGSVFHRLAFAQAIDQELLSDYQVVVVGVTDRGYAEMAERGVFVTIDGKTVTDAGTLARQIGLLRAMQNHDLHRVVSFHSRIRSASAFAASLPEVCAWLPEDRRPAGSLWAEHVSGKMTSGERETRLNRLRAVSITERGVLSNARCLAEGVDVPTLDGVAFIDPRRSQVDVVQAVGRAIRKAEGKTIGTIVIPVFVDESVEAEQALEASDFDSVWQVVKALRDHDDALADELDGLRRELGRRNTSGQLPAKIFLDLPVGVSLEFARAFDTKLVETTTPNWEFWYGLLQRFAARENHVDVLQTHTESGYRLGTWINRQRTAFSKGRLSPERIARLEAMPGWDWDPIEALWELGFSHLERFAARENHARVPVNHLEDGYRLGQWITHQRNAFREGRLLPERVERLEALPGWAWNAQEADWEAGFSRLERFVARESHARVYRGYVEEGYQLGQWVGIQRIRHRESQLSPERAARLKALPGWEWDNSRDAGWRDGFSHLQRFAAREGHARVPRGQIEDGYPLGGWANKQRAASREGRLSPERIALLEALPGWDWDPHRADWETAFSHLERFAARENHTRVPVSHLEDGFRLGQWVNGQRNTHRAGRLLPERIARLETLAGWVWNALDADWEEGFSCLERFAAREGHTRFPNTYIENGYRLGQWAKVQRRAYGAGKVSAHRIARLEALPGWVWNATKKT